jgi:carbon dioxide concentrating mechanism protein CcmN
MYLPPLQPSHDSQAYVSGDVIIHPSATVGPGVILHADPESQIRIAAGVCIGMGAILHAHQGVLEVEVGANLGAGVLFVGKGKIGANACVGATTTILNSTVAAGQVVLPGSLLGDGSRQAEAPAPVAPPLSASEEASLPEAETLEAEPVAATEEPSGQQTSQLAVETSSSQIYGKVHLNNLLSTLLPHRQSLNSSQGNSQPPGNSS